MASSTHARRESKKKAFLKSYARLGRIVAAARSARISRDSVHDWRRIDPSFAAACCLAKYQYQNRHHAQMMDAFKFFAAVVKPLMPSAWWPPIERAVLAAIRFKEHAFITSHASSSKADAPALPKFTVFGAGTIGFAGAPRLPVSEMILR